MTPPATPIQTDFPGFPIPVTAYAESTAPDSCQPLSSNAATTLTCALDMQIYEDTPYDALGADAYMFRNINPTGTLLFLLHVEPTPEAQLCEQPLLSLAKLNALLAARPRAPGVEECPAAEDFPTADRVRQFCSFYGVTRDSSLDHDEDGEPVYRTTCTIRGCCLVANAWAHSRESLASGVSLWLLLRKVPATAERQSLSWTNREALSWQRRHPRVRWYFQLIPYASDGDQYPWEAVLSPDGEHGTALRIGKVGIEPQMGPRDGQTRWAACAKISNTYYAPPAADDVNVQAAVATAQFPLLSVCL